MATIIRDTIISELERHFVADKYAGPSVLETLAFLTPGEAAAHPLKGMNSIWQITLHIRCWIEIMHKRLEGDPYMPSKAEDWPPVPDATEASWEETLGQLRASHDKVVEKIRDFDDKQLSTIRVPEKGPTHKDRFFALIQHNTYHSGQIILLRRAQGWDWNEHLKKLGIL